MPNKPLHHARGQATLCQGLRIVRRWENTPMRTAKDMKHISRIDQEKKNQHGWWVRIHRDGQMIHKFFSDLAHRSKSSALSEARKHRDALLVLHPKPMHGNQFNKPKPRNTSGVVGVHKTTHCKRGRVYDVWAASWVLPDGRKQTRKFHFSLDGNSEAEAKKFAIKARKEGVALIEKLRTEKVQKHKSLKDAAKLRRQRAKTKGKS